MEFATFSVEQYVVAITMVILKMVQPTHAGWFHVVDLLRNTLQRILSTVYRSRPTNIEVW